MDELLAMGFSAEAARHALARYDNNVGKAANFLLEGAGGQDADAPDKAADKAKPRKTKDRGADKKSAKDTKDTKAEPLPKRKSSVGGKLKRSTSSSRPPKGAGKAQKKDKKGGKGAKGKDSKDGKTLAPSSARASVDGGEKPKKSTIGRSAKKKKVRKPVDPAAQARYDQMAQYVGLLTEEQRADLEDVFAVFDRNSDHNISKKELQQILAEFGYELSREEAEAMVDEVDLDKNGKIDKTEFLVMMATKVLFAQDTKDDLKAAFAKLDVAGDGTLDASSLYTLLTTLGDAPLSHEEAVAFIADSDVSADGILDWRSFVEASFGDAKLS
jgi:Ca2+-binding EF-hand superfamily protein